MLTGHIGIAFAVKSIKRDISISRLVFATLAIDIIESIILFSQIPLPVWMTLHFLPGALLISGILILFDRLIFRETINSLIIGSICFSHLLLDYATSIMPIYPNGPIIGLNLHEKQYMLFPIEIAILIGGMYIYYRSVNKTITKRVKYSFSALLFFYITIQTVKAVIFP